MSFNLHPAFFLIVGGLTLPLFRGKLRQALLIIFPLLGFLNLLGHENGSFWNLYFGGYDLEVLRVDKLSLIFGYLFHLAALLAAIYSLHLKDGLQHMTGFMYAGSAIGAVFAGDLITLFIFWEFLAITSVFQIWARRSSRSSASGLRYLLVHVTSGLFLLTGAAIQYENTGSISFDHMELVSWSSYLIFIAFGIKCAFPLLHTWLVDSYPEATPTGTVFLSSFTTKTAVYALARGFEGTEQLIWIGAVMAMFPIFYAVIENDLRRVLGYSMINQIGFMVAGIGFGAGMGVNGAVAHAFNDVIFKGLLFMSMGAVLFRTGRINGSDLGGLYKSMPYTTGFCLVGASSISAFPLFSGFVSKSMVMQSAADQGYLFVWLILLFASAGVFHHAGIKIPFFAFFSKDSGIRCKEAPINMLFAMWVSSFFCIFIGCYPRPLYSMLPYPVDYLPYTVTHVLLQLQVLFFSALAFVYLKFSRLYPPELKSMNIDFDWVYRRFLPSFSSKVLYMVTPFRNKIINSFKTQINQGVIFIRHHYGPKGIFERTWLTSSIVMMVTIALAAYLIYYF